ncbi:hypothetical protein FOQG_08413 [Fusarium oxysporum f. sp. raphani 54005]|uniref:Reticulocyte-binding protein 2 like protein a n=1 Tax=Fusarium oxysporum f. sp. raphani 54005 TaxID=1089458 RepID=X0C2K4_FUSOX|nr:hypothetical protein FOQG_08413 [Fusarium oxysporum f. sp. raphani 54005]EXK88631.1 hypothetical protein FOQG_08413 [Fusarium oxysporum f. sp. raphani 54005]KAJ4095656.1 hypothetical protein NW756_004475 [Fusarium oxysporum]
MSGPPPPPPPHGGVPKGSGLPPGKYDIFVIPEHSSGGGFLYLPSMQPNVNSFAAGFASALILVVLGQTLAPAFRTWWEGFHGLGNMAMAMLVVGVGFGAWALGRFQNQDKGFPGSGGGFSGPGNSGRDSQGGWSSGFRSANAGAPPPPPPHGTPPPPPPHHDTPPRPPPHDGPKTSWHSSPHSERPPPPPPPPPPQPEPQPTSRDEPEPPPRPPPQARPPQPQTPPETPPPKPKSKKSKSKPKDPPRDPPREPSPPPKPRAETPPPPPKPKAKPEPKPEPEPEPEPAPAPKAEKSEREKQKGSWEKAREEMRKKEEERKIREAEQKRREEAAKRLAELRAKDAKERQEREKERQRKEQEARDKKERLEAEQRAKELAIKLEEERRERERLEKEAKEAREREAQREKEARELEEKKKKEAEEREARRKKFAAEREALRRKEAEEAKRREEEKKQKELEKQREQERLEKEKAEKERIEREKAEKEKAEKEQAERERAARETADRQRMSYAYSGVGEKISMWPNGRPPAAPKSTTSSASKPPPSAASSQRKPGPAPSAAKSNISGVSTENSYRPYDKPKQQPKRRGSVSSLGSESSWAASQTTGRTTPPPSTRAGPYSTKDPDKIVISGVYLFMNQFSKTPASQLISGVGTVTDGLILRVTTEGLFIDDDVRNVPQREWDVKTWTLKQVEVWCPPHCLKSPAASSPAPGTKPNPLLYKMASSRARDRGATQPLVGEEADVYLTEMLRACKTCCRLGLCNRTFRDTNITSSTGQTGEWKSKGLHLLRATNREGKRYLFVIDESESWKVSTGLQRLRKSPLAQQLAVSGMAASDARGTLEMLGWA